ncbi:MAG: ceramidase domain-containing protein [Gammaproteobacteria bacterium]
MNIKAGALIAIVLVAVTVTLFVPPVPQDPAFHLFADTRTIFGIPNFWDVMSNLPFLLIGLAGILLVLKDPPGCLPELRQAYLVFFSGVLLVAGGSAYYHWNPNNQTLFWDRLPITFGFMGITAAVIGENISIRFSRILLWPLVMAGAASVIYWYFTEQAGAGDLRAYGLVQFLPMLLLPMTLLMFSSRLDSNVWLWSAFVGYGFAKVLETFDHSIFAALGVSGHTLKHLAAAAGAWCILEALKRRYVINNQPL